MTALTGRQRLNELHDRQYEAKRISEATYHRIRGSGGERSEPPEGGDRGGSGGGGSEPTSGAETTAEKSGVKPGRSSVSGSTYPGSGLGAFEPFLRESVEDMRALKARRDAAMNQLRLWIDSAPEVPEGDWYKDFAVRGRCRRRFRLKGR